MPRSAGLSCVTVRSGVGHTRLGPRPICSASHSRTHSCSAPRPSRRGAAGARTQPYRSAEEVIEYVNDHDRPLAFYPFTNDKRLAQRYVTEVLSGSVGVNEVIVQVGQHDLPFGGVGASGMGHYHGYEGFLTFSKLRPVFRQGRFSSIQAVLQPPYRKRAKLALRWMFKLRAQFTARNPDYTAR